MCIDRLEKGQLPLCVASCPMRALDFGPIDELKAKYGDLSKIETMPFIRISRISTGPPGKNRVNAKHTTVIPTKVGITNSNLRTKYATRSTARPSTNYQLPSTNSQNIFHRPQRPSAQKRPAAHRRAALGLDLEKLQRRIVALDDRTVLFELHDRTRRGFSPSRLH